MVRHIIPNIIPPLIVNASLGISTMIMEVAAPVVSGRRGEITDGGMGCHDEYRQGLYADKYQPGTDPGSSDLPDGGAFNLFGTNREYTDRSTGGDEIGCFDNNKRKNMRRR